MSDREQKNIDAFIEPTAEICGMKLRKFSAGTLTLCRKLNLSVIIGGAGEASDEEKQKQFTTLLFIQTQPIETVLKAVKIARTDRDAFEQEFLLPFELSLPIEALPKMIAHMEGELELIGSAFVEVAPQPGGAGEKAPPN